MTSGEQTIRLEIIVSSFAEMLESEIGRCMHEDRIMRQRQDQHYDGHLARNIEFLLEFMFALPASCETRLDQLPIQIWKRYLPDYFDEVRRNLFRAPSVELNAL